jgi:GDPmannose 4,6-dehydratase
VITMKTALIFGVDGQDGSYMADMLLSKGYRVIGWIPDGIPEKYNNIRHIQDQILLTRGSMLDQHSLTQCIETHQPDEIYNFASPSFPASSWNAVLEVGEVTALGVARLLEAIRLTQTGVRYYQASSSELFGFAIETPQNETTPFHPRNPYGVAKLYAHWLTVNYRQKYSLYTVCGITYNHESPRRGKEFVTRKIVSEAVRIKLGLSNELQLGNLDARRDWGFAGDYVEAIWRMLQQEEPEDYVIATGKTFSVREFCDIAFGCLGLDYRDYVVQDPMFWRPVEVMQLVGDNRKIKRNLGWEPKISFEKLIQMIVAAELRVLSSS